MLLLDFISFECGFWAIGFWIGKDPAGRARKIDSGKQKQDHIPIFGPLKQFGHQHRAGRGGKIPAHIHQTVNLGNTVPSYINGRG